MRNLYSFLTQKLTQKNFKSLKSDEPLLSKNTDLLVGINTYEIVKKP